MSKNRLLVLVTTMVIVALLAGCAQPAPTATPRPTVAPTKPAAAEPTAEPGGAVMAALRQDGYMGPALTTEPITLRMLKITVSAAEQELYDRWVKEFTDAFPNIKIEEERVPYGDLYQKLQVIIAGGEPPDVIKVDGPWVKAFCYFDAFEPLNDWLAKSYFDDYLPATLEEHSFQGKVYAWPERQSSLFGYYNRDLFVQAGIDPPPETTDPAKGWTWEKYLEAWKKLTIKPAGSEVPEVWGLAPSEFGPGGVGSLYYYEGMFIRGKGDPNAAKDSDEYKTWAAISEDGTDVKGYIDTPQAIEAMQWYQDLFQKEKVSPTAGMPNGFPDGRGATAFATSDRVSRFPAANPKLNMGVTPVGYFSDGVPFTHSGSTTVAVSKNSKHKAEAVALNHWFHTYAHRVEYAQVTGNLPAMISVFAGTGMYDKYPNTLFQAMLSTYAAPRPPGPGYLQYDSAATLAIRDIGLGADPTSTLHEVADEINGYLAQFKK